ncbi:hypothetical protein KsCSTR_10170 [Candidatus Kuenenia stuttgartiensis]|uniref:Uncharacterized protein n=1 Tax=Kuenenia stuttgartiensis TaxID=174633 RepID=Q1PYS4_KUEST|nr:hypothetical protein KsCSTR_10170 [Candidatus Kuenenia stuttgartiensis]CAJ72241.1 unknown protein [Candidatus Kuenenia stuttgartiensis]
MSSQTLTGNKVSSAIAFPSRSLGTSVFFHRTKVLQTNAPLVFCISCFLLLYVLDLF